MDDESSEGESESESGELENSNLNDSVKKLSDLSIMSNRKHKQEVKIKSDTAGNRTVKK